MKKLVLSLMFVMCAFAGFCQAVTLAEARNYASAAHDQALLADRLATSAAASAAKHSDSKFLAAGAIICKKWATIAGLSSLAAQSFVTGTANADDCIAAKAMFLGAKACLDAAKFSEACLILDATKDPKELQKEIQLAITANGYAEIAENILKDGIILARISPKTNGVATAEKALILSSEAKKLSDAFLVAATNAANK